MTMIRTLRIFSFVAMLALAGASARADFQLKFVIDGDTEVVYPMNPVSSGGTIEFNSNNTLGFFDVTGSVDSNANTSDTFGKLNFTFSVVLDSEAHHTLEIYASDNGFTIPTGSNLSLSSSATGNWDLGDNSDTVDFIASESHGPATLFGVSNSNSTISLVNDTPDPYSAPGSASGDAGPTYFDAPTGYGITLYAKITLGEVVSGPRSVLVTGSAIVGRSVPEPSSFALAALGGLAVLGLARRRKVASA